MGFRKDINALRAYAVLGVLFYHFNFSFISGGFAGVDVFFVISGFLMASIIMKRLDGGEFKLFSFYLARFKRILPPLVSLCIVLYILGFFYLIPGDFEQLKQHLYSSVGFFSNYVYWLESGYFSSASKEKWLLHTWSLSVEFQFYIIFPLCLIALYKATNRKFIFVITIIFVLLGFAFSIYSSYKFPTPIFYCIFTRFWELLIGLFLFLVIGNSRIYNNKKLKNKFFYLGMFLIFTTYIVFDTATRWPGLFTLVPVLATCFIILADNQSSFLVNFKPVQFLGKISYSLYLWHWPVAVLFYHLELNDTHFKILGLLLSIILGYISFELIELKFTSLISGSSKKLKLTVTSLFFILSIVGLFISNNHLYSTNDIATFSGIHSSPNRSSCHTGGADYLMPVSACKFNNVKSKWAVIGDSHGVELSYSLAKKMKKTEEGVVQYTFSGCIPSYQRDYSFSSCSKWTEEVFEEVLGNTDILNVVLVFRYKAAFNDQKNYVDLNEKDKLIKRQLIIDSFYNMVASLSKSGKIVYIISPFPDSKLSVSSRINVSNILDGDSSNITIKNRNDIYLENSGFFKFLLPRILELNNVNLIDTSRVFCDDSFCYAVRDGDVLFFDDDHPSVHATDKVVDLINKLDKK